MPLVHSNIPVDRAGLRQRTKWFLIFLAGLLICFAQPLWRLARFSFHSELYSHVLLVPAISGYLLWTNRRKLDFTFSPARGVAGLLLLVGLTLVFACVPGFSAEWRPETENAQLGLLTLGFLFLFVSGFVWIYGAKALRSAAFPLAFLIFMAPMPLFLEDAITHFLQHASAEVSYRLLTWSGMSVFRDGTDFALPGINIGVARECSGIRSSLVLFMIGLLAGYFFLRQTWSKVTLAALLIPLGILRNSFRIFTLAQLAVHVDHNILDSDLHHRGGPMFFAVSLVPFFLLIWLLRKSETRLDKKTSNTNTPIASAAVKHEIIS